MSIRAVAEAEPVAGSTAIFSRRLRVENHHDRSRDEYLPDAHRTLDLRRSIYASIRALFHLFSSKGCVFLKFDAL